MGQDQNNDKSNERLVATFAIFVLWIKIFDWLRLFEQTSFYMLLVRQTLHDMWSFVVIYLFGLGMVGSSMYMLELNKPTRDD